MYKIIGADGKEYGPVTPEVLRDWVAEGRANRQSKVRPEGGTEWVSLEQIPELAPLLGSASSGVPPALGTPGPISIPPTPRNNSYALTALTLGILSVTLGVCCCYGLPFSVPGIICALVALNQIKSDPSVQQGKNLAIAGLVLCLLSLVLGGLMLVLGVAMSTPDMIRRIRRL